MDSVLCKECAEIMKQENLKQITRVWSNFSQQLKDLGKSNQNLDGAIPPTEYPSTVFKVDGPALDSFLREVTEKFFALIYDGNSDAIQLELREVIRKIYYDEFTRFLQYRKRNLRSTVVFHVEKLG